MAETMSRRSDNVTGDEGGDGDWDWECDADWVGWTAAFILDECKESVEEVIIYTG